MHINKPVHFLLLICLWLTGPQTKIWKGRGKIIFSFPILFKRGVELGFEHKTEWCRGSPPTSPPMLTFPLAAICSFQCADNKQCFHLYSFLFVFLVPSETPKGKMEWVVRQDYSIQRPLTLMPSIPAFKSHPLSIAPSRGNLEPILGEQEALGNTAMAKWHSGDIFSYLNKLYFHSLQNLWFCAVNKAMEMPRKSPARWLHLCAFCSRGVPSIADGLHVILRRHTSCSSAMPASLLFWVLHTSLPIPHPRFIGEDSAGCQLSGET